MFLFESPINTSSSLVDFFDLRKFKGVLDILYRFGHVEIKTIAVSRDSAG